MMQACEGTKQSALFSKTEVNDEKDHKNRKCNFIYVRQRSFYSGDYNRNSV